MLDIHPDIRQARQPPPSFYTSDESYRRVVERMLARSWHFAGTPEPHPSWPRTLLPGCLDEPVLLTRQDDDSLSAWVNACTHRGHRLLDAPSDHRTLRCRYHGRRFDRSGACLGQPFLDGSAGFPGPEHGLVPLPLASWGPLVFVGLSPMMSFDELFAPVQARLGFLPLHEARLQPDACRVYDIDAPWLLYVDNYLEGLHAPFVHPSLSSTLDLPAYRHELLPWGTLQVGVADPGSLAFELPEGHPDHGQRIGAYWYFLLPNLMLNAYPWGLSLNVVEPQGPLRTRVRYLAFVWAPELRGQGAGGDLNTVELEDEAVVEEVARGLRSRHARTGGYVPGHEDGLHHVHRRVADIIQHQ